MMGFPFSDTKPYIRVLCTNCVRIINILFNIDTGCLAEIDTGCSKVNDISFGACSCSP